MSCSVVNRSLCQSQVTHKNLIISSLLQLEGCGKVITIAKAKAAETEKR